LALFVAVVYEVVTTPLLQRNNNNDEEQHNYDNDEEQQKLGDLPSCIGIGILQKHDKLNSKQKGIDQSVSQ
jgi:hypothetical protein